MWQEALPSSLRAVCAASLAASACSVPPCLSFHCLRRELTAFPAKQVVRNSSVFSPTGNSFVPVGVFSFSSSPSSSSKWSEEAVDTSDHGMLNTIVRGLGRVSGSGSSSSILSARRLMEGCATLAVLCTASFCPSMSYRRAAIPLISFCMSVSMLSSWLSCAFGTGVELPLTRWWMGG